jgi:hypothetical protein
VSDLRSRLPSCAPGADAPAAGAVQFITLGHAHPIVLQKQMMPAWCGPKRHPSSLFITLTCYCYLGRRPRRGLLFLVRLGPKQFSPASVFRHQ